MTIYGSLVAMELEIDSSKISALRKFRRKTKDVKEHSRATCILMLYDGFTVCQVCQALDIDDNTVYRHVKAARTLSVDSFLSKKHKGYFGKLDSVQLGKLSQTLTEKLYTTSEEVCEWVLLHFGVRYTSKGMAKLLVRLGFSYKKTKQVPCKADRSAQENFLEGLKNLLVEPDSTIYYVDGVHPTHNTRSLYGWIPKGTDHELPTVSGRDRVNINGALNARNPTEVIIQVSESINAESTKALYQKIIHANPDKKTIYVITDNAKYYRNKELKTWLEGRKIVQVFLPSYSPNLNLIERLWKFLRKKVIDPIFYRTKEKFRRGILDFFKNIEQYEVELTSLLTLNFRTIQSHFNFV